MSKVKAPFVRSPYNYDVEEASNEAMIPAHLQGESLTVQSMAEDANINVLMDRYGITGKMPENPRIPVFGDFTEVGDYQSALQAVISASDGFMELTANVRARFENNPQKLLEFMSNDANREEAVRLGLVRAPPAALAPPAAAAGAPPGGGAPAAPAAPGAPV